LKNLRDAREDEILSATLTLIAAQGVDAVSMARVAEATGLSRPALYQYFASKEDLLAELVINEMADLSNEIDARVAGFDDALEQIRIWVHYSLAHLSGADHRAIREISIDRLPTEKRGMLHAMHGHFMLTLLSPLKALGISDPTPTAHMIFAAVSTAAKRIDEGSEFVREAAALEAFAMAGIAGAQSSRA
jgi:AcrR family transcriptional regulator